LTSEEAYQSKLGEEVAKVARENEKAQKKRNWMQERKLQLKRKIQKRKAKTRNKSH